jgi:hypothetical protein
MILGITYNMYTYVFASLPRKTFSIFEKKKENLFP